MAKYGISDIVLQDSVTRGLVQFFAHVMLPILKVTPESSVSEVSIPWTEIIIISVQVFFL